MLYINHIGPSMKPTLKPGDRLRVIPYDSERRIQRGDVIVFLPPNGSQKIVHRVVSVGSQGIRTRGDNNDSIDRDVLKNKDIIGQVVLAQRGKSYIQIHSGAKGQAWSIFVRTIRKIDHLTSPFLKPPYRWLAKKGIFRRWPPSFIKFQILSIDRSGIRELKLLMGKRVIGHLRPGDKEWFIRRPFRLFIDESALPQGKRGFRPLL